MRSFWPICAGFWVSWKHDEAGGVLAAGTGAAEHRPGGRFAPVRFLLSRHIDITGLQKRLTAAEALWKKRGPDPYRMNTDFESESGVHSFQLNAPRSESGWPFVSPVRRSATPNVRVSMPVLEHVDTYTVSGLFAQVRSALRSARGTCGVLKMTFDPRDGHVLSL